MVPNAATLMATPNYDESQRSITTKLNHVDRSLRWVIVRMETDDHLCMQQDGSHYKIRGIYVADFQCLWKFDSDTKIINDLKGQRSHN